MHLCFLTEVPNLSLKILRVLYSYYSVMVEVDNNIHRRETHSG